MDNLYKIQAVNPELANLLRRVKTIYAICGGDVPAVGPGKKDDFQAKKSILIGQLHNFDQLVQARDTCGLPHDSRDFIRLKTTVAVELKKLEEMVTDLAIQHKKEVAKAGHKMPDGEMAARKEVMESIMGEFREAFKHAKGFGHADSDDMNQAGTGINVMSREQLEKGQFAGAGIRTKRQDLTGEQLQKMEQIQGQTREQDQMLDEISKGLDELKDLAEKMSDELQLQDKMLNDLEHKTDKTQAKMDQTNDRMKEAMRKLNDKASNCCVYVICIFLLLGMVAVVYNMVIKKK